MIISRITLILSLSVLTVLSGCKTYKNTTTGKTQYEAFSREEEIALGASEGPKLTAEMGGEVQNPSLRAYVNEVGQKLKNGTAEDGPQRTWVFTLLDSDIINAFALPGERVFMSRGLADKMTSEAQLAGVLGHEIGHVMARHTSDRVARAQGAGIAAAGVGVLAGIFLKDSAAAGAVASGAGAGAQIYTLGFSRDQESEADHLGMRYMAAAGYNPKAQREVMEILKAASGGGAGIEWLQTHPAPQTRISDVDKLLAGEFAYTQSGPQASRFQNYADQYRQRYLSVRAAEPARPAQRGMLENIMLEDPTSWCAICRAGGHQTASTSP